ncbi:conserved hypothetical protein (plasmid) [Allorhizobium ampelinum S4]|uniref:Sulfotransferase family protein n=1 Tax=Allorhizobium ampelinum (strain ATCC BAA-846 / DSM 112012 / S4) TaxID=311402 RepID=B9K383_ALLAM|nr:sulfotransferase family 2 domain-containing protein [Allorhizobium ampelinum]ACM39331.1 conserved hypothetical protein [Allorhizobium ampelinum S4]
MEVAEGEFKPAFPIKPAQQLVFVHIPKCGGTSMHQFLANAKKVQPEPELSTILAGYCEPALHKHSKAAVIRDLVGPALWQTIFTFSVVRNPWDLMLSSYRWWLQKAGRFSSLRAQADEVADLGSFEGFLKSDFGGNRINECEGDILSWLSDENGQEIVDFVGRLEDIEQALQNVFERAGLAGYSEFPRLNSTVRGGYQDYYNAETKRLIQTRFQATIDRFEYQF